MNLKCMLFHALGFAEVTSQLIWCDSPDNARVINLCNNYKYYMVITSPNKWSTKLDFEGRIHVEPRLKYTFSWSVKQETELSLKASQIDW